jgi:2-methylcitrate dehydratase PrpD
MSGIGDLSAQVGLFAATPARGRARLTDLLVDAVGVGLAGASTPVARGCLDALGSRDGTADAWIRGAWMHALDFDDTHEPSLCHTGTALLPGLLALGRARRSSGAELLEAFELGLRFVDFLAPFGPQINSMGLHSTGILGTLGAGAACGWLLSRDPNFTARTVELASLMTGGLGVAFGNDGKPIQAGRAAQSGLHAAQLAASGAEAPTGGVFGPRGVFALWLGANATEQLAWGDPCVDATLNVAVKPYPSCFLTHSTIDAALRLREQLEIDNVEDVERFEATVHPIARDLADKTRLGTANDAKFSLRYCVLAALTGETPVVATFEPDRQVTLAGSDARWHDWVERCHVQVDESAPRLAVTARVVKRGGDQAELRLEFPSGSASNPLDAAAVESKFRGNATAAGVDADAALAELRRVPDADDVSAVKALEPPWQLSAAAAAKAR